MSHVATWGICLVESLGFGKMILLLMAIARTNCSRAALYVQRKDLWQKLMYMAGTECETSSAWIIFATEGSAEIRGSCANPQRSDAEHECSDHTVGWQGRVLGWIHYVNYSEFAAVEFGVRPALPNSGDNFSQAWRFHRTLLSAGVWCHPQQEMWESMYGSLAPLGAIAWRSLWGAILAKYVAPVRTLETVSGAIISSQGHRLHPTPCALRGTRVTAAPTFLHPVGPIYWLQVKPHWARLASSAICWILGPVRSYPEWRPRDPPWHASLLPAC